MSSLEELSQDNGALGSQSAGSSHSSTSVLLLYDAMGQPPLAAATAALIRQTPLNPAIAEQELNRNPQIADWRYRLYLDLLVSVQHAPKAIWPAPQWDVAMMMHTHVLSPIKFAHDISSNPRYSCLAGKLDFPLLKLDHKLIHLHDRDTGAVNSDEGMWNLKYPTHLQFNARHVRQHQRAFHPFILYRNRIHATKIQPYRTPPSFLLTWLQERNAKSVSRGRSRHSTHWTPCPRTCCSIFRPDMQSS